MRHSIRRQFALIFIGLMAGTILLCWTINTLFLERYYIKSKTGVIYEAYEVIRQAANSDSYSSEKFARKLDDVCSVANITVLVMDANSQLRYESVNGGHELEMLLLGYIFGFQDSPVKVLEQGEDYILQRMTSGGDEFLVMYGSAGMGISFIMRTPIESIRESADIANRFFTYAGMVGTLVGGAIIWFVSGRITKPIKKLNSISEQMVHLDFEAKYSGREKNEIGMLGENINKLSSSLERSISELKTANNELQRDIEKKEKTDEMRKEFLANVSHELKTPIALIQGYAEGLAESVNDDSESRSFYCEVIMDEASKMNRMVQKLLTLNQLEFGSDVVEIERFDVTALVRNLIQAAGILAKQNGVRISMREYPPIYVWGDEYKIEEVFRNYFSNALNYCSGEKLIRITMETGEGLVRVGVFNTGDPVPEEALPHLWEKFYKVDKARVREYGGSGVGLSIVKAIMESMNQKYGVENRENGVLFWFELETAGGGYGTGAGEG